MRAAHLRDCVLYACVFVCLCVCVCVQCVRALLMCVFTPSVAPVYHMSFAVVCVAD